MPRLSIIIPCLGEVERLERTLSSVLRNRPDDSEVIVVHGGLYADPYGLTGEVRFVETARDASMTQCVNVGLNEARGELVHLLRSGVEVAEGWTAPAIEHFDNPRVAAVAPLVLRAADPNWIVAAGATIALNGAKRLCAANRRLSDAALRKIRPIGPTSLAAFYRRAALTAIAGYDAAVGDDLADIDAALSLRQIGFDVRLELACRTYCDLPEVESPSAYREGLWQQRLLLRHAAIVGASKILLASPVILIAELVHALTRPQTITKIVGRAAANFEVGDRRRFRNRLHASSLEPDTASRQETTRRATLRVDRPHAPGKIAVVEPTTTSRPAA